MMLRYYATDQRGGRALANLWRVTSDVTGSWTLRFAYDVAAQLGAFAGHGGFNDPDMLPLSAIGGWEAILETYDGRCCRWFLLKSSREEIYERIDLFPLLETIYMFFFGMKELHEATGTVPWSEIRLRLGSSKGAARRLEAHQSRTQFLSSKRCGCNPYRNEYGSVNYLINHHAPLIKVP